MEQSESMAIEVPAIAPSPVRKSPGYFTTVQVMKAFNTNFMDAQHCREWILKQIHGDTPGCPECHCAIENTQRFWIGKRMRCSACGKWFTALTGTFLAGAQFDFREVLLLAVFLWFNMSNHAIADKLHVDQETVRLWRHKFDACLPF